MPDYIYGLILIESLGHEAEQNALRSPDHAISRKSRTIWPPREKNFRHTLAMPIMSPQPAPEV
jgi:hypothetical protein